MHQTDDVAYICVWDDLYVGDKFSGDMVKVLDGITWRVFREYQGSLYMAGHGQFAHSFFVTTPLDSYDPTHQCSPAGSSQQLGILDMEIRNGLFFFGTIDEGVKFRSPDDCNFMDLSPQDLKLTADNSVLYFNEEGGLVLGTFKGDLYYKPLIGNWEQMINGTGFDAIHDVLEFKGNYYLGNNRLRRSAGDDLTQWTSIASERTGDLEIFQDELYAARSSGLYSTTNGQNWKKHTDGLGEIDNDAILYKQGGNLFLGAGDGSIYRLDTETSVQNDQKEIKIGLSPNPVMNNIQVKAGNHSISKLTIYNLQGQRVLEMNQKREGEFLIDVHSLRPSTYILQFLIGDRLHTEQFVIVR